MPKMQPPASGVTVRMYRQGHGDCFLLCFARAGSEEPVFMMIDCGYKRGSQITRSDKKVTADRVVADIAETTGKRLDVVAVTHEHEDHVNALGKFADFEIGEAWFAWTEDPEDADAKDYRRRHNDQLLGLVAARNRLSALAVDNAAAGETVGRLDELLELEFGVEDTQPGDFGFGAAADPSKSANKRAMKVIKDAARRGLKFISPHKEIMGISGVEGLRVFALGPPRSEALLKDEDPTGDAAFPGHGLAGGPSLSFFAAAQGEAAGGAAPFPPEHGIAAAAVFDDAEFGPFFATHYGRNPTQDGMRDSAGRKRDPQVNDAADWRRVDEEWLYAAEAFALKLNSGVNNTSLVLAFELPQTKKVLLFAADAQSGNWKSWTDGSFRGGPEEEITAKDLLGRTVFYKVGHHGSHNATLTGKADSPWAHLEWMGQGRYGEEFTAMIPANRDWAINKAHWDHPLQAIKDALIAKAQGRVLQLDMEALEKPEAVPQAIWDRFAQSGRTRVTDLYIEHVIEDIF